MQKYFTEEEVCKNKQLNSKKFAYISGTGFS